MKNNKQYDAIVIGGGMSGSYAAKELCQAGMKTLLLERGPEKHHPSSYTETNKEPWDYRFRGILQKAQQQQQPVQSKLFLHTEASAKSFVNDLDSPYTTTNDTSFDWFRSYQLGGKSMQWGRQCYRLSDLDFNANKNSTHGNDWPLRYKDIQAFYDEVEKFVGVSGQNEGLSQLPDGHFQPPMPMNDMEISMRDTIKKKWHERHMIMGRVANLTQPHNGRGQCISRDKCALGCPHGGYYSGLSGAIPAALATGNLDIVCDSIVERIIYDKTAKKGKAVRVIDANTLKDKEYSAPNIFVCAGTLNSTWLLLNSALADGVGLASGQLGHNLMDHHNMVVSAVIPEGPKTYPQGRRPTRCYLPRYRNLKNNDKLGFTRGYGFELSGHREDWTREFGSKTIGTELKDSINSWGDWRIVMVGYGECLPYYENTIALNFDKRDAWGLPTLNINAEFKDNEKKMNKDMHASAKEILNELGAVDQTIWGDMSAPGGSIHEMGTARMGSNPETSVLDPYNRMWEANNVYVTDGSAMPSSACQNPSLTYMALTSRAVKKCVEQHYA